MEQNNTLTALSGVRVGHSTQIDKLTGCTAVVFDRPMPVAFKSYGGAVAGYNTESLTNGKSFNRSRGLFISGGSYTGLMSGAEIQKAMIEDGHGDQDFAITNPNISGAVVFDFGTRIGQYDPINGRHAYKSATNDAVVRGNVGAGTGTSAGKFNYLELGTKNPSMKTGVGCALVSLGGGIKVTALSVVNPVGNVIGPDGSIIAGNRDETKKFRTFDHVTDFVTHTPSNTTITIVGINVDLKTRENYEKVAHFGAQGQIRAIDPVNMSIDGDTVFVFSNEEIKEPLNDNGKYFESPSWPLFMVDVIGDAATKAVRESIYDACYQADSITFPDDYKYEPGYQGVIPSAKDYK